MSEDILHTPLRHGPDLLKPSLIRIGPSDILGQIFEEPGSEFALYPQTNLYSSINLYPHN